MKKILSIIILLLCISHASFSQKLYTKNGHISFFSKTSLENIKADNNQVLSVLDTKTGEMQFSVIIKSFHFEKALMEEHFNENYLESGKYPKASFKGTIADINKINFNADGKYAVGVTGDLTIHGVSNKVSTTGTITINGGKITGTSVFNIALADYKITVPKVVDANISKTIEIKVDCLYDQKM